MSDLYQWFVNWSTCALANDQRSYCYKEATAWQQQSTSYPAHKGLKHILYFLLPCLLVNTGSTEPLCWPKKTNKEQILQSYRTVNSIHWPNLFFWWKIYTDRKTRGPAAVDNWRLAVCLQNISDVRSLQSNVPLWQSLNQRSACVAGLATGVLVETHQSIRQIWRDQTQSAVWWRWSDVHPPGFCLLVSMTGIK